MKKISGDMADALGAAILIALKELTFATRDLTATLARNEGRDGGRADWQRPAAPRR